MRIAFLVPGLEQSGGIDVVMGHAERLEASGGFNVDVIPVRDLAAAAGRSYDIAIGTWWETFYRLFEIDATHYAGFLQSFEQRFYLPDERAEQLAAGLVYQLPLHFLGASAWICHALEQLRPDARCTPVLNGIDKSVFTARERSSGGPLRVLVEGQPELWFKGVHEAIGAARAMSEPAEVTLVSLDPPQESLPVDRVLSGLSPQAMADLYRETDVVLKLSRVEGLGLVPLEAFHCGTPCVVTPYSGHEDYVRHGENGFVCGFDDPATATAYLNRLASDREELRRLSRGALDTAAGWPSPERSTEALAGALREIAATGPVDPAASARQLIFTRMALDIGREERRRHQYETRALQGSLEIERASVEHLKDEINKLYRWIEIKDADLEAIRATRAYRLSLRLRRLARGR